MFDVAVIGAGMAGASLAWRLSQTARVLLLERESQPGVHSTGRSAAMFMEGYGYPQMRALTRASRAFYEAPPSGFSDQALLAPRGVLYLAVQGQAPLLEATYRDQATHNGRIERWPAQSCLARVPSLKAHEVLGGVWDPDSLDINVHALHQGYLRGFRANGGRLLCSAHLVAQQRDSNGGWCLRWAGPQGEEQAQAAVVVNAAGAWADELAQAFGVAPLGLQPCRRSAFTFAGPAGVDVSAWPTVASVNEEGWYFKPDAGRLLGSPANAEPTVAHDVQPEELDIATGIARIEAVLEVTIRRPLRTWAGLRSFTPDHDICMGFEPSCSGFFWLAGQGGCGIQSAAGASAFAAALIQGDASRLEQLERAHGVSASACSPKRFR